MTKILFSGCSIARGEGLENEADNPNHYSNIIAEMVFNNNCIVENISVRGLSNFRIFLDTATKLTQHTYDYAFVGWTTYPRFNIWTGLELYECRRCLNPGTGDIQPHNGNDISFSSDFLNDLRDKLVLASNEHREIVDLVNYVSVLSRLSDLVGTKIYFINNFCHWDQTYFNKLTSPVTPSMLSSYTNKILNSQNRDDDQISALYDLIHSEYQSVGGIHEDRWLNLYNNISHMWVDVGNDNYHPGPKTHKKYGEFLVDQFKKINII